MQTVEAPKHDDVAGIARLSGFRIDVQALRGLAVLLVVLFHAGVVAPGGFVGVDVFFVISGFVIGRGLLARLAGMSGGVMRDFYVRRSRRILPALALTLVVVILLAPLLAPIGGASEASPTGIAAALFSANLYLYRSAGVGYFAADAELNPLLHTWSLSVEEQFYFVIPVLLLVAWWYGRRRWGSVTAVRIVVAVVIVASFLLSVKLSAANGYVWRIDGRRFAFYSPFTRAWEFAVGLALVVVPVRWLAGRRARPVLVVVGVAMIGYAALAYSDTTVFPGVAAAVPVIGAALVIYAGTRREPRTRARRPSPVLRPMTWMGDISYSWYLWHWPLIVFIGAFFPGSGAWPLVVGAVLSLAPAWWSYRMLEQRVRTTSSTRTGPTIRLALCCILAPLVAAAIALPVSSFVDRKAEEAFATEVGGDGRNPEPLTTCDDGTLLSRSAEGGCSWGDPASSRSVVVVGDSNAAQFGATFEGAADEVGANVQLAVSAGCPVIDLEFVFNPISGYPASAEQCHEYTSAVLDEIAADPPDVVVIAMATDQYLPIGWIDPIDAATGAQVADDAETARLFEASLARVATRLRAAGSRVVIVDVVPKSYAWGPYDCSNLAILIDASRCVPEPFPADGEPQPEEGTLVQARAAEVAGADTWSFRAEICPDDLCPTLRDDELVWADSTHISPAMARALVPTASRYLEAAFDESGG